MKQVVNRILKLPWTLKQPLSRIPEQNVAISDLFLWRNNTDWETFFELMDISSLFGEVRKETGFARVIIFDHIGAQVDEIQIKLYPSKRKLLRLADYLGNSVGEAGTFSVFHPGTPDVVSNLGSFIAERGYVSYRFKGSPIRSYVHGNLDAIAFEPIKDLELLGCSGVLVRQYNLQHQLEASVLYEIGVVNTTPKVQRILCEVLSIDGKQCLMDYEVDLRPKASHIFNMQMPSSQSGRLVIKSHLVMARPLVFRIKQNKMDVFHG